MEFLSKELETFELIKKTLNKSKNILFFFHDDPDGLCSFLQFRHYFDKGYGVIVKSKPILDSKFFNKIDNSNADVIVTLDLAVVMQEFVNYCNFKNIKLITIDHHTLTDSKDFFVYYNPKLYRKNDSMAVASLSYYILDKRKELLWLSAVGTCSDWQKPKYYNELKKDYPYLLKESNKLKKDDELVSHLHIKYSKNSPENLLFNTELGLIARIISFSIKGNMNLVKKIIACFIKVKTPKELLNKESGASKLIMKNFEKYNQEYEMLLKNALKNAKEQYEAFNKENIIKSNELNVSEISDEISNDDSSKQNNNLFKSEIILKKSIKKLIKKSIQKSNLIVFTYKNKDSFTGELCNELFYYYENDCIIVGRLKDELYRISVRYNGNALKIVTNAMKGLTASGGGHKNACGLSIKEKDFPAFLKRIKALI